MTNKDYQVLLVTDKDEDARFLEQTLVSQSKGMYVPLRAVDMDEAVKFIATRSVDAVVLDCSVHGIDPVQACLRVHAADAIMPIIAVQETSDESLATDTLTAGAQDVLLRRDCGEGTLPRAF